MAMSNSPAAATRPARSGGFTSRKLAPYLFLAPFLLLFIAFIVAPLVYAFYMSLFRDTLVGGRQFAGAASYIKVAGDAKFWGGVWNLVLFGIVQVPIMLGLALLFAIVLDRGQVYAKGVFRLGFFLPYAVPSVIATIIWGYLYGPTFGPFTQMAKAFNLPPPDFLSPGAMIFSLANIVTWEYVGYNMVIYYAALKAIPSDLAEASRIDGASSWQFARLIQLPLLWPAILLTIIFSINGTLQLFNEPYLDARARQKHHQFELHAEPLCLFAGDSEPAVWLCGRRLVRAWHRDRRCLLHLHPDHQPPSAGAMMTATTDIATFEAARRRPGERRRSRIMLTLLLSLFLVYSFVPLVYLVLSATKTNGDLFTTFGFGFGTEFNLWQNLSDLFSARQRHLLRWMFNSVLYSTVAGLGAAIFATAAGYAFAKFKFRGRNLTFGLVLGAVFVPQTALVVPIFLLLALSGLSDNPLGVILPSMISPIGVYLMRVYIEQGVDDELLDAARVDGAGEFLIFRAIVLRLVAPGMVTVALLSFVGTWNNYFLPLIVLRSQEYQPITVGLSTWYQLAQQGGGGGQVLFSIVITGALVSIIPVIVVFLLLQRFWQGGLTAGAIK